MILKPQKRISSAVGRAHRAVTVTPNFAVLSKRPFENSASIGFRGGFAKGA